MMAFSIPKQIIGLVVWLVFSFVAAGVGAVASIRAASFYTQLARPVWAPPPSVFGPVWTVLYALMAVAAWLIWRIDGFTAARLALALFLAQLVLNALWSWLFFGWHLGAAAFADIVALWILLIATLIAFWSIRWYAGALLVPYLLWVSFAAALNFVVWRMNVPVL
jgi:tryptophan-rich sensory protein